LLSFSLSQWQKLHNFSPNFRAEIFIYIINK
jgi:hypothetical protein